MFKPNIRSLNPLAFTKVLPKRNEIIDNSKAEKLPNLDSYKANQIASALHPSYQELVVSDVKQEIEDAKTYTLTRADGKLPAYFSAGQYIAVAIDIEGKRYSRPYSLSSSPKQALEGFYTITVKRANGGLVSNYILDNLNKGDHLYTSAPLGNFTYEPLRDAKNIVAIAGGSGITPFYSFAKAIKDNDEDCTLTLLYGSKTLKEAMFQEEFKKIEKECSNFKLINVLSDEKLDGYESGFISAELIKKYAPDEEYSLFICGPQAMYNFLDKEIEKLNIRRKFVRHELFGELTSPTSQNDYIKPENEEYNVTVIVQDKKYEIKANVNDSLLVSMERSGINVPNDCRSGACGWCHSQLISGKVYTPKKLDGRRQADIKYGYIHPCVSFPLSDLIINVPLGK